MSLSIPDHHEQQYESSCVFACICMILKWRGASFDENALYTKWNGHGSVNAAVSELGAAYRSLSPDDFQTIRTAFSGWFANDCALIVTVCGPRYVQRRGIAPGGSKSKWKDLAPAGDSGGPFHALVLAGSTEDGFLALDPYYPANGQPLELTDDDLTYILTGQVVVCSKQT